MRELCLLLSFLLVTACAGNPPAVPRQAHIVRDNFGVPHVYADDIFGLYFGYGYAAAQDRLFQLEMTRRSTQGMVAEVLGTGYLEFDKNTRKLFDPASIRRQLAALGPADRDIFGGFAAGINAWLQEIRARPDSLLPRQFLDHRFEPGDWTAYDVAMIFVGTMVNRYGDYNSELDNLEIYRSLVSRHGEENGRRLFDLLNPRFTDNAPTTIPAEDWSAPVVDNLAGAVPAMPGGERPLASYRAFSGPVGSGMSNCYVIGRDKARGASAILVNGPQFGWFNPAYVYSVGLHGAGIDVVGNTPFAYPVIMFGHNRDIAWGSTWAGGDIVDIYAERLNPDDPLQYFYAGAYRDFEHRVEQIAVRGAEPVSFDVYRSVHGPVMLHEPAAGVAYAKHRAWDGGELDTLLAWIAATRAGDFESWKAAAAQSAINVNMYYADVRGNIGYFFGGWYPRRAAGHDNRLPASGDGSMDWLGRMPVEQANPHIQNPGAGFLANWNNKPGQGVMNPDFFFFSWSRADRIDILNGALGQMETWTAEQAWELLRTSSYADLHASYLLPLIDRAVRQSGDPSLEPVNAVLQAWDGQSADLDGDGYYDGAATAVFRRFTGVLLEDVLADDLGEVFAPFSSTGYPAAGKPTAAGSNIQTGMKAVLESLNGRGGYDLLNGKSADEVIRKSLKTTLARLAEEQGGEAEVWRLPVAQRPFSNLNFLGVPQAGSDEVLTAATEQNRGTENDMILLRENAIVGWEVTPPGQSGFVSPAGDRSAHYDDQLGMYQDFGRKRMWFYARDVAANMRSEQFVAY